MTDQQPLLPAQEAIFREIDENLTLARIFSAYGPNREFVRVIESYLRLLQRIDWTPEVRELIAKRLEEFTAEVGNYHNISAFIITFRTASEKMRVPVLATTPE